MKSIIMTAQDAREFEKLGGLTITKPIKPAPAAYVEGAQMLESTEAPGRWYVADTDGEPLLDSGNVFDPPVQPGDIVFLREPWHRLKNPSDGEPSDRVILAADSTVAEGQTSYKWSSPVSMPEEAARRFAVVSKVEPIYNENVAVWSITLEAVTKGAAEAGEAGALPYSDAPSPEEGSDYYTYAGDMSPEDHQHMVDAINADRARLAEVQDRLIRIDLRRRELAYLNFEGRDKVDPNDRAALLEEDSALDAEQVELTREEADLRHTLEDAGAPSPTVEDHAREKLAAIRSRRAEIAAADQKARVFEDLDGEEENLTAEERDLAAVYKRIGERERCFTTRIVWEDDIPPTLTARTDQYRGEEKTRVSIEDLIHIQTFPEDFDFIRNTYYRALYVCAMSVPPVMIKRIVSRMIEAGVFEKKGRATP